MEIFSPNDMGTLFWCFLFVFGIILVSALVEAIEYAINKRKMADYSVHKFWRDYQKTRDTVNSCNTLEQLQVSRNMVDLLKNRYNDYTSLITVMEDLYGLIEYKELCLRKPSQS